MKQKKQRLLYLLTSIFVCMMIMWGTGCSAKRTWYKPGAGQLDFNIDDRDCRIIAEETARQATLTGKKLNLVVLEQSYETCIFSKGWSLKPVSTGDSKERDSEKTRLAVIHNNLVQTFGRTMSIPGTFSLISNRQAGFQGVNMQTLFFKGENDVYL
jgi:hypothetical protein